MAKLRLRHFFLRLVLSAYCGSVLRPKMGVRGVSALLSADLQAMGSVPQAVLTLIIWANTDLP
jgi:hypothetical protein